MKKVQYRELLERYQRLIDISQHLASTLDLNTLLHQIMQAGIELSHAQEASILLYDPSKNELFFQTSTTHETEKRLRGMIVPAQSIAGWVAQNRKPLIVGDVHSDQRWFDHVQDILEFDTKSLAAVPLIAKNQLIGVIEVLNKLEGVFDSDDQETLTVLAAHAAIAIQNARLFEQSDTIAELVHEIRTPITSITTISYLMQRPELTEAKRIELTHTIQRETQRLNEMATEFLDFARLESGRMVFEMALFNLTMLVKECQQVVQPYAEENQVTLNFDLDPKMMPINADRAKIKQVLMNLLTNAIKYNRPNGQVNIKTAILPGSIQLVVQDTGIGIPTEDLPHIFEKYYRSRISEKTRSGTGLGLSISKRIIENHGGAITVDSQVNQGSSFLVTLPYQPTQTDETTDPFHELIRE